MKLNVPEPYQPYLRIGTCSWKYDSWKGLFYNPDKQYRPDDYLPDYAQHLNSVEVDQWFWSLFPTGVKLPTLRTVRTYTESVPDDFAFTVKAPNALTLTHFYSHQYSEHTGVSGQPNPHFLDNDLLNRFIELLSPMGKKLGPVMLQFEYLNKQKMPSMKAFLDRLHEFFTHAPPGIQFAIECRNPNYLSKGFFDFLKEHRLGFVYLEGYYMPPIGQVFDTHHPDTADFTVIRLHGPDRMKIEEETKESWNRIVSPKPEGIKAAVRIVTFNRERKIRTYVNVNNHFEGSAPITIERFVADLEGQAATETGN